MDKSNNTAKVIGALLLGTAIGGIIGVLFAPDKGSDTRKKILAKGEGLTDAMNEKLTAFTDMIKKDVETVKEKSNDFIGNGTIKA